jgi:o-succinylbenzoate synthase
VKLFRFNLPFRKGALLYISSKGRALWSEASPLPGFSKETLEETLSDLTSSSPHLPSSCFALESARLQLEDPAPLHRVKVHALLKGTKEEILEKAARCKGFTHAKVKIKNFDPDTAYSLLNALKEQFILRVDCNKKPPSPDFFSAFPLGTFDYVEEPGETLEELAAFPHPIALDESLRLYPLDQLLSLPTLKALIVKPTLQSNPLQLHAIAQKKKLSFILSSSFESGIGLNHIALLANRLGLENAPMGLDTVYPDDLLEEPLLLKEGYLYPQASPNVKKESLCPVF